jgi:hypothetical protein
MWRRLARAGLGSFLLAVCLSVGGGQMARVGATERSNGGVTDDARGSHCRSDAVAYSYYYADGSMDDSAGDVLDTYEFEDYNSCLNAAQALAINVAGRSCTGVSRGTFGIAYSRPLWDVFWNDEYQGTVDNQQYDCGDVSVY